MRQYPLELLVRLGHWSYLLIAVAAALECAAFTGLLVPGESVVIASGFFAHAGMLELDAVIAAATLGAIVGCVLLGYGLRVSWRLAERWIGRTSAIIIGAVCLVAALSWLWRRRARAAAK